MRLKKELATLREVLRSYVLQIDSLNRMNEALTQENSNLKTQNEQARQHITNLSTENETLSDKVAIASQLDATGIYAVGHNKKGKAAKKIKDVKKFVVGFTIARNVTTATGMRSLYVRITTPTGDVLTKGGTFDYENRQLEYSIRKDIEYTGEEQSVTVYWDVAEALSAGTYRVDIFADGQNIGTTHFTFDK
jgi:regulator of replication initiation timing